MNKINVVKRLNNIYSKVVTASFEAETQLQVSCQIILSIWTSFADSDMQ